jgi:hypothetical protein
LRTATQALPCFFPGRSERPYFSRARELVTLRTLAPLRESASAALSQFAAAGEQLPMPYLGLAGKTYREVADILGSTCSMRTRLVLRATSCTAKSLTYAIGRRARYRSDLNDGIEGKYVIHSGV